MNVEYTGRQYEITPLIRKQVETGLGKLTKMLGETFDSKVVLVSEKRRYKAEITVTVRKRPIVGVAEAAEMTVAVGESLWHEDDVAPILERARVRELTDANAWTLQIAENADRSPGLRRDVAHERDRRRVLVVRAVREVDAGHVHAGPQHRFEHGRVVGRRPEGGDDLGSPGHVARLRG